MPAFTGHPEWYSGDVSVLRNAATRAHQVTTTPYTPYPNNRLRNAPFNPLQTQAFQAGQDEFQNPEYQNIFNQSTVAIRNALGQNISPTLAPYLAGATANPTINAQQYMNPYNEAVTNNIGRLASRNLTENILPQVNDQFIRSGAYGSSGRPGSRSHEDITGRAIRDTQQVVADEQNKALQKGYSEALGTSVGQQGAQLGAGRVAGNALGLDLERQISGGTALQNLGGAQQAERRQGIGVLSNLGTQQQQQEQAGLNTAFQDFQAEQNFPYLQAARENELVRGLPVSQYTASTNPYVPPLPQPSPWSQGAGLLAGAAGMMGQRQGYAEGGTVKKKHVSVSHLRHFADGGDVDMSPIQKGVNDALDTSEIQAMRRHAQKLSQERINPAWAAVSRAGFNLAANPKLGVLGKLGEAGNAALDEYSTQLGLQDNRESGAAKIYDMINTTRELQKERLRNHELALKQFEETSRHNRHGEGLQSAKEGREAADYEKTKGMIEGPGKMFYNLETNEEGKQIAKPLEGMISNPKSKADIDRAKKINEEAKRDWGKKLSHGPNVVNKYKELEKLNEEMKTPGYESFMKGIPLVGGVAASTSKYFRVGQEIKDKYDMNAGQLAAEQIKEIPARAQNKMHQQLVLDSKPNSGAEYEANKQNIKNGLTKEEVEMGEAEFGTLMLHKYEDKNGIPKFDANEIKLAWKQYVDAKLAYEEANPGEKFPNSPEEFLIAIHEEKENGQAPFSQNYNDTMSMSDEELRKIAGG